VNVTEDELEKLKALLAERAAAAGDAAERYLIDSRIVERVPKLLATVERLREAIWPGLPKWAPTEQEPQQDFHEAMVEALRKASDENDQYVAVIQGGKRLPAPELNQDPAFAAFVLGGLEKDRANLLAERDELKRFKEYVHQRLDLAGVTSDPESPHKAAGCRIGGRLDELIGDRDFLRKTVARLRTHVSAN
jgi:hypothetical protein